MNAELSALDKALAEIEERISTLENPSDEYIKMVQTSLNVADQYDDTASAPEIRYLAHQWRCMFQTVPIVAMMDREAQGQFADMMLGLAHVMNIVGYVGAEDALAIARRCVAEFDELCSLTDRKHALLERKQSGVPLQ